METSGEGSAELTTAQAAERAIARAGAPFDARPTLVWSADARRLLAASPAARPLAANLADETGAVREDLQAGPRLSALAGGLAPEAGQRLEKLRFARSALVAPATLACRSVTLDTGEEALLTAFLGPLPAVPPLPRSPAPAADRPILSDGSPPAPAPEAPEPGAPEPAWESAAPDPLARLAGRGVVRFVWRADAEARVLEVSPTLAETVGPQAAAIVGRPLADVLADVAHDPRGLVVEHVARGETFSGRTVLWRIDGTEQGVEVDLAGLPLLDRDRRVRETRGFGLIRTDALAPFPARAPEPAAAAAETDAPEQLHDEAPSVEAGADALADALADDLADEPFGLPEEAAPAAEEHDPAAEPTPERAAIAPEPEPEPEPLAPEPESEEPEPEEPEPHALPETVAQAAAAPLTIASLSAAVVARLGEARHAFTAETRAAADAFAPTSPANDAAPASARAGEPAAPTPLRLSPAEHSAFREIARALGARYAGDEEEPAASSPEPAPAPAPAVPLHPPRAGDDHRPGGGTGAIAAAALERLPVGILVHRGEAVLHANRPLLDMLGHADLDAFRDAGGVAGLVKGRPGALARVEAVEPAPLVLAGAGGRSVDAEVRLTTVELEDGPASLLAIRRLPAEDPAQRLGALELETARLSARLSEQDAILDTATDGVVVLDAQGRILSMNRSAEALFGHEENEIAGEPFTALFEAESHSAALDYLAALGREGVAGLLDGGREVLGRVRQGGAIPLFMTLGRVGEEEGAPKFCAVLRDVTAFKQAEAELLAAKRAAEDASAQKSDFLARISHEVRTPLNAIIGFAEVMREERFGPVGNERYKDYLADIHSSGQHVLSLINDLLDLAKIEAGRMDLSFRSVSLNELVTACVALIQPQAARDRIVVRTSFLTKLPAVVADERSVRQIVLNLLSNAVKFTDAGGQVIVSTALTDRGEVAFRVRDTGIGMDEREVEAALEPFRQLATSRRPGGTGLGLPLTKALVEANRGAMTIASKKGEGTLVEVTFPVTVGAGV
ncbi:ATP-binding protein [Salinarimonas sp.]|uniref:ATP-binding protein n=1 Tax=Salinarimonas sp. TaxID=2766526 RepID=UPI0032D8DB41